MKDWRDEFIKDFCCQFIIVIYIVGGALICFWIWIGIKNFLN